MISEIVKNQVWLGPINEAISFKYNEFRTIVDVLENPSISVEIQNQLKARGISYVHQSFVYSDKDGYMKANLDKLMYIRYLINKNKPCIVCCAASIERSPLAVAWYIHEENEIDIQKAYEIVTTAHPITQDRSSWLPL